MQALVTGASGFLGGRLIEMLLGRGAEVTVLARPSSALPLWPGVKVVRAEFIPASAEPSRPNGHAALFASLRSITHIFHCAGCSTDWAPWSQYREANVAAVSWLLEAARHHAPGLQRFLHVSTTDVYGYPAHAGDETMARRDLGLPYNQTKIRGEELVWQAAGLGLPVTVVRPASIYGPRGKAFVTDIVHLLRQRLMLLVDGGRAPGGFVYVDDVCEAMILAATELCAEGKVYNVGGGDGTTWSGYTRALARALRSPAPWLKLPFSAAMSLARVCEAPHRAGIPGRPLLTRHAVYLLGRDQGYSIAKARAELGWEPRVGLEQGLALSVAALK